MINTFDLNEARKQIQKLKKENNIIVIKAQSNEFNRKILENPEVDIFLSPEMHDRQDELKQRDSGLNEVLCKLAKKNNIKIGIDLNEILPLSKKEKAIVLSRIIQNIRLCSKFGVQIKIFPETYKKQDIFSFFSVLKGTTQLAKLSFK